MCLLANKYTSYKSKSGQNCPQKDAIALVMRLTQQGRSFHYITHVANAHACIMYARISIFGVPWHSNFTAPKGKISGTSIKIIL